MLSNSKSSSATPSQGADFAVQRFKQLKSLRTGVEDTWRTIIDYVIPRRGSLETESLKGERNKEMFDGTAAHSVQILADGFLSYLTSPMAPWFRILPEKQPMADQHSETKRWLSYVESVFAYIFNHSNFYSSVNQCLLDGCSFGTACLFIDEDLSSGDVYFSARHPKEIYIDQNQHGVVDCVFREYKQTARNIVSRFENVPTWVTAIAKDTPFKELTLIHGCYPRKDRNQAYSDNKNKKFVSIYVLDKTGEALEESGYDNFPYAVWRFRCNSGETYGTSVTWDALSDIKAAQAIAKTLLEKAHQSVKPPIQAPAEMRGQVSIEPEGMNWYVDPSRQISAIQVGGDYPIGRDMQEKVQQSIKDHFRTDFFLSLNQQAMANRKTAYEVSVLQGEKASVLAAPVARIEKELLNPVFARVYELASRNGWIPQIPQEMNEPVKIKYIGPLALSQKRHFNTQAVTQGLQEYAQFVEMWPELRDRVDPDALSTIMLEAAGLPQITIRDDKELSDVREAQQAQQQRLLQQQELLAQSEAYKKTIKAPEKGSGAEALLEAG